ncbi:MAG: hypothetical protein ACNA8L_10315 [Luteolibacter sp.]
MPASAATINAHLTNFASGLAQDRSASLANFIAPVVPTGLAHGQFKRYSDKNDFQVLDTARAVGGTRKRIEFGADDPFFNCQPQGLETTIDDHERDLAGDGNVINLQEAKVRNLVGASVHSHEKKVFDAVKAAKAATGSVGEWSNAAKDPVDEIDGLIEAIATETGRMPNRIAFGIGAWRIFRNHPKVIARQPGADLIGLRADQAARMMLNPELEIRVGMLSADSAKFGAGKNATNIVGGEVFIFFGSETPDQYDASFAKTFTTRAGMVDSVREYRDERAASDVFYVDWSEDIQVVAAASGRRITLS